MRLPKLLTVAVIGLLVVSWAAAAEDKKSDGKKRETVEGRIMKVDPSGHRLTVKLKEKRKRTMPDQREFPLDATTKFIFFEGAGKKEITRKEAYKHEQFKEGVPVTVICDSTDKVREVWIGRSRTGKDNK